MSETETKTMKEESLRTRSAGSLNETFHIPDFQRGYRWRRDEVITLLDDLNSHLKNHSYIDNLSPYYLQPIVVFEREDGSYNLIDGQQRLTTLFLINMALQKRKEVEEKISETLAQQDIPYNNPLEDLKPLAYSVIYDTRTDSEDFLKNISDKTIDEAGKFPDFLYMWHAYQAAKEWIDQHLKKKDINLHNLASLLEDKVKLIWYELPKGGDQWKKFSDLNIGKIPLTNSELIKALFLRDDNNLMEEHEKTTVVQQWDDMERELGDKDFWSFLTNEEPEKYDTKIDLIFDIIANKSPDEYDDYFTFIQFDKKLKGEDGRNIAGKDRWDEVYLQYLRLRDWYEAEDNEYYHKIGYLVAAGKNLQEIFNATVTKDQKQFRKYLDDEIKNTINLNGRKLEELSYANDYSLITRILLLFNVMTLQKGGDRSRRYSFRRHKRVKGGWSLEHIHAQNSRGLTKGKEWNAWISAHIPVLNRFRDFNILAGNKDKVVNIEEIIKRMKDFLTDLAENPKEGQLSARFDQINEDFSKIYYDGIDTDYEEYKDSIANLALLGRDDNAALNNAVFSVKRDKILNRSEEGFVPFCTREVFLKAYNESDENEQFFFWSETDRKNYLEKIKNVLEDYLPKETEENDEKYLYEN
ncbi:MAG: DUF262 domain-containing HNH endonuclease family protein [Muribaculaceae bacterium]|nr:DUF262 domain-containing HNH endonuclease family protein [Muribaculaceae bacterium]